MTLEAVDVICAGRLVAEDLCESSEGEGQTPEDALPINLSVSPRAMIEEMQASIHQNVLGS